MFTTSTGFLQTVAQLEQAKTETSFDDAERLLQSGGDFVVTQVAEERQLDGLPLFVWHRVEYALHPFGAFILIRVAQRCEDGCLPAQADLAETLGTSSSHRQARGRAHVTGGPGTASGRSLGSESAARPN